jgi:dTDP-4-dehydrorhamnose 3,5-epimerase-like enzyme
MNFENTGQPNYSAIQFKVIDDGHGSLVAIENSIHIPFEIKRVFYIYNSDESVIRGRHANKKSQFVLIALNGSLKIRILTPQKKEDVIFLSDPSVGLYLDKMVWKEMFEFSKDCVLLVLSSELYDKEEYVYDGEFFA